MTANGRADLSDAVALLGHIFLGDPSEILCRSAADVDDNARLEVTDAIRLLAYLFLGGLPPEAPFESCGVDDETDFALFCESYPPCE